MKIEQLERFLVVADCLNFTTAADQLYVGQSTISRQIAALEDELGVTLLIRGPRSVELTEAGRVMQEEGVKLLKYIEQLKKRVQTAGRGTMGTLRVTSIPAYVPVLTELQDKTTEIYPNLQLEFSRTSYDQIPHQLDIGAIDIGLTFSFWDHMDPAYERLAVAPEHFSILCSKRHWAAQKAETGIHIDELRDQEFYFGRDGLHLCMHPQDFENSVVTAATRSPFASLEDMLMQLNVSSGVAALPSVVANTIHDNLAVVPLADPEFNCELILLWRKDNKSPALARFLEVVHRYLNEKTE